MLVDPVVLRPGNKHDPHNLPIVLGGQGGGRIASGQHLVYSADSPLANLFVSMLQRIGINEDKFASGTGTMRGLEMV